MQMDCARLEELMGLLDNELPKTMSLVLGICNRVNSAAGGSATNAVDMTGTAVTLSSPTTLTLPKGQKCKMSHAMLARCVVPCPVFVIAAVKYLLLIAWTSRAHGNCMVLCCLTVFARMAQG